MNNLMGLFPHTSQLSQEMMLVWADKHPFLFTAIEITTPTAWIVLVVAGFNMVNGVMRGRKR